MKTPLFFLILFVQLFNAQNISGKVLSNEDQKPVPYAKISIENEITGTIGDENGNFELDLNNIEKSKKLLITVSGYDIYSNSLSQLSLNSVNTIFLQEKVHMIAEVNINPKKFVQRNWGVNTKTKRILLGHSPEKDINVMSKEIAMLFRTHKKTKLEKINLNINYFKSDKPVFIRFSVYDKNLKSILTDDINDEITIDKIIDGVYSFDVSRNNIWSNEDFYVGIQILSNFKGAIFLSVAMLGNKTVYRNFQTEWENVPVVSPAINIDVKVQK